MSRFHGNCRAVPIYVYECEKCGHQFEYMQSMAEPAKTECEACQGKLMKIIAPTAFVLKGGGWYKDLYSSSPKGGESSKGAATKSTSTSQAASTSTAASGGGTS